MRRRSRLSRPNRGRRREETRVLLPVTATGVVIPRWLATGLASGALIALVATTNDLLLDPPAAEAVEETERALEFDSDGDGVPDRPDRISAGLLAVDLDLAVEDMSARTESATEVVNPDGTVTVEDFGGPVRIASETTDPETGEETTAWTPVDYTLSELPGGRWAPVASPANVVVNGTWNNKDEAARVEFEDGSAVAISWPAGTAGLDGTDDGILPTPTIDGATATYALEGYSGSVDLVIGMTTAGVTALLRINDELTAEETAVIEAQGVTFGIRTVGPKTLSTSADAIAADPLIEPEVPGGADGNGLVLTDAEGSLVGSTPELQAWESSVVDDMGVPAETVLLETALETVGTTGTGDERVVANELTVTPPEGFLTDASTEYPVVLDPEIQALTQTADTWVRNGINGTNGSDASLLVGKAQAWPNNPAYSYLLFNGHSLTGKGIVRAELGLYQYQAGSCGAKNLYVHAVSGTWSESTTTWGNQPGVNGSGFITVTANRGSTCSNGMGYTTANVTPIVQNWADYQASSADGYVNRGFRLGVPSNGDTTFERRFCSMNYNSTTASGCVGKKPYLKVTYNAAPSAASQPTLQEGVGRTLNDVLHVSTGHPTLAFVATDPEGSSLSYLAEARASVTSGTVASSCTASAVASGATATCKLTTALVNGQTYVVRARATDRFGATGNWSQWRSIRINNARPSASSISCAGSSNGIWTATARASSSMSCTVDVSNAVDVEWSVGGAVYSSAVSSGVSTVVAQVPLDGWVSVTAEPVSSAGLKATSPATFGSGSGQPALESPDSNARTSSALDVEASAPTGAVGAVLEWRHAGAASGTWSVAEEVHRKGESSLWDGGVLARSGRSVTGSLVWDALDEMGQDGHVVELRIRFNYQTGAPLLTAARQVLLAPSALGGNSARFEVGPFSISGVTGEATLDVDGVEVTGSSGGLAVSRSFRSFSPVAQGPAAVFGPGWTADLAGPGIGAAGYQIDDSTSTDGTIKVLSPIGDTLFFEHASGIRESLLPGEYREIDGLGEIELQLEALAASASNTHKITLTTAPGEKTEFVRRVVSGVASWTTASVVNEDTSTVANFSYNAIGNPVWIGMPPSGSPVACSNSQFSRGCRALEIIYSTQTQAPRVSRVVLHTYAPSVDALTGEAAASPARTSAVIAEYAYDASERLTAVTDPRLGNLATSYTYTEVGGRTLVASVRPAGQTAWRVNYDADGRVSRIERDVDPRTGTGSATWRVVYDVPLSGEGLPSMTPESVASWGQTNSVPWGAAAIIPPSHSLGTAIHASDWKHATLNYFDARGRLTNVAGYGGGWQVSTVQYDQNSNVTWELKPEGRRQALAAASSSVEVANQLAQISVYRPDGGRLEESYGPQIDHVLADGTVTNGRLLRESVYDDEAPAELNIGRPASEEPFSLLVEGRSSVVAGFPAASSDTRRDVEVTRLRYDPVETGDVSGWDLGLPTRVSVLQGQGDWAVTVTRRDDTGAITETRSPQASAVQATGSGAGETTRTILYSADASAAAPECRHRPEWAGELCMTTVQASDGTGNVRAERVSAYTPLLEPSRTEELVGTSVVRTTVNSFDSAGRMVRVSVAAGSTSLNTTTTYSSSNALPITITSSSKTQSITYDSWARPALVNDGSGNTTETTFDSLGRPVRIDDGKGVYAYAFDGVDADGDEEYRGLVTSMTAGVTSLSDGGRFVMSYNSDGLPERSTQPAGIQVQYNNSVTGKPTSAVYSKLDSSGASTPIAGFSRAYDVHGRAVREIGSDGDRRYIYDQRGRLIGEVEQHGTDCLSRTYQLTNDSHRIAQTDVASTGLDDCAANGASTTATRSQTVGPHGELTTQGYAHDNLGRTSVLPNEDASSPSGSSDVALSYYPDDTVKSIQQSVMGSDGSGAVHLQSYVLDWGGRPAVTENSVAGVPVHRTEAHYADDTSTPAWEAVRDRGTASSPWVDSWVRYVRDPLGGIAATQDSNGVSTLNIVDLGGDVVGLVDLASSSVSSFASVSSFGDRNGLGWHASQSVDNGQVGGLKILGARIYNPATGRFLTRDPVDGGNDNSYSYPTDPVNTQDLSGLFGYDFQLYGGVMTDKSLSQIWDLLVKNFGKTFVYKGCPAKLKDGMVCNLKPFHLVTADVRVSAVRNMGWTFYALTNHFDPPGSYIRFNLIQKNKNQLWLKVHAYGPNKKIQKHGILRCGSSKVAYVGWNALAGRIGILGNAVKL